MAMARPETILVIGGGLGGLAFAQLLRHSEFADKYKVQIFERDATRTHRGQGYMIGINKEGMSKIDSIPDIASVFDEMRQKPFAVTMVDGDVNVTIQMVHGPGSHQIAGLVNRWKLRSGLAEGLDVQWGKKFVRYEEFPTHVVAYFDDGTEARGDLLIGADGSNSRVREQRCPTLEVKQLPILGTAGTVAITARIREESPTVLELSKRSYLNRCLAAEGNTVMWMEYEADGGEARILWSFSFPVTTTMLELSKDPVQLKQAMDAQAARVFGKELTNLIQGTAATDFVMEATRHLKSTERTEGNPLGKTTRVTLLGDSAHATTTHRGLGANTAFADAAALVAALAQVEAPWQALAEYEDSMIKRGFETIKQSMQSTRILHLAGAKSVVRNVFIRVVGWILWAKRLVRG